MEKRNLEILIEKQIIEGIQNHFSKISDLRISSYGDSSVYENNIIVVPNLKVLIQSNIRLTIDDIVEAVILDITKQVDTFNKKYTKLYIGEISLNNNLISVSYGFINAEIKDEILYYNKTIEIKNYIGTFKDEYIDSVWINYQDNKFYEVIPIENKISIPYIKDGSVTIIYKKLIKNCIVYNIKTN